MILAGDVGGTKTRLGLFERSRDALRPLREASYSSTDFGSFEAIVDHFVSESEAKKVEACAVGVAGPVIGGRSQIVNLRWSIESRRLSSRLGLERAVVLNDLEATAWGIPLLRADQTLSLTPGLRIRPGNAALIAAGTGLGMALLFWDGNGYRASASEGGHQEFGPRDDEEIELLKFLRRRHGRVSVERVAAGPGISAIYQFLLDTGRGRESPTMARRLAEAEDSNAVIAGAGLDGGDRVAERALDLFVSIYGAAAGDLALVAMAVGGVFVGGGIAPKILPKLRAGGFIRAFRDKGRLSPLLEGIPVRVILEPRTALLGAAAAAAAGPDRGARILRIEKPDKKNEKGRESP